MSYKSESKDWLSSRWSFWGTIWHIIVVIFTHLRQNEHSTWDVQVLVQRGWWLWSWSTSYFLTFIQNSIDVRTTKMSWKWLTCFIFCNFWFHLINPVGRTSWRGAATVVITTIVNYKLVQISKKKREDLFSILIKSFTLEMVERWCWRKVHISCRLCPLRPPRLWTELRWGTWNILPSIPLQHCKSQFFWNRTQWGLLVSPPKVRAFLV